MEYGKAALIPDHALRQINRLIQLTGPWARGSAVFFLSWISIDGALETPSLPEDWGLVLLAAASAVAAGVVRRFRWPLFVLATVGWAGFHLWPAVLAASYYAGLSLRRRADVVAYALSALAIMAVSMMLGVTLRQSHHAVTEDWEAYVLPLALLVALPLVAGLWVNARRQVISALRDRAERLEHEQRARTDRARAQERTRIAREMHDIVAHRVSLMVLHAGALEVGTSDERSAQAAALIQDLGREALVNLREVLGVLRSPHAGTGADDAATPFAPQPMLADLDRLIDQSQALGISIRRHDEGTPHPLPAMVERTAYRVVQEALTNVHKHAGDTSADVFVRYLPGVLEVLVDNGPSTAPAEPLPGAGLGLMGLGERVKLAGGEFQAGPLPGGGFRTLARLPAGHAHLVHAEHLSASEPVEEPA